VQDLLEREAKVQGKRIRISNLRIALDLRQEIGTAQRKDDDFQIFKVKMMSKKGPDFLEKEDDSLYFPDRICMPGNETLKKQILAEAHKSKYAMHPGEVKMYQDLRKTYWWPGMKKDVTHYISTYLTCQKVKAEHKKSAAYYNYYRPLDGNGRK
jgi:hypothetical protein